jgi:hypothetical protein
LSFLKNLSLQNPKLIINFNLLTFRIHSLTERCSFPGIQFAGAHLRELQKAFKNPAANLGLIFEEATKRAIRSVGLGSPPSLSQHVHPNLEPAAALAAKVHVWLFCSGWVI